MNDIEKGIIIVKSNSPDDSTSSHEIAEMQPSTHEDKKTCCESLCRIFNSENFDLTKNEYRVFNLLRKECIISYDETNSEHEKLLNDLKETYIDLSDDSESRDKFSWKLLGFQVSL